MSSYRPRVDGSWTITFSTNILRPDEKIIVDRMHQQVCCLLIKAAENIDESEHEAMDSIDLDLIDDKKTPSQRLRNVLFVKWKQEGGDGEFKEYYKVYMEKIIDHYKAKLI